MMTVVLTPLGTVSSYPSFLSIQDFFREKYTYGVRYETASESKLNATGKVQPRGSEGREGVKNKPVEDFRMSPDPFMLADFIENRLPLKRNRDSKYICDC